MHQRRQPDQRCKGGEYKREFARRVPRLSHCRPIPSAPARDTRPGYCGLTMASRAAVGRACSMSCATAYVMESWYSVAGVLGESDNDCSSSAIACCESPACLASTPSAYAVNG